MLLSLPLSAARVFAFVCSPAPSVHDTPRKHPLAAECIPIAGKHAPSGSNQAARHLRDSSTHNDDPMISLTLEGNAVVDDLAKKYQLSRESVSHMLDALQRGGGTMAQFQCPEFGTGQWMQGGMIMVGDMFNYSLKARVNDLFSDLAEAMRRQPLFELRKAKSPEERESPPPVPSDSDWWPGGLGRPSSTGSQNSMRYAIFPASRRLVVEHKGKVDVYDTEDHEIRGVSQQQGTSGHALQFTSQHGTYPAESFPIVSGTSNGPSDTSGQATEMPASKESPDAAGLLRKLAELRAEGILTEDEFAAKKAEILRRI